MPMPPAMLLPEIQEALTNLPEWNYVEEGAKNGLKRHLEFEDFLGAMRFMQACALGIERMNHHPVWTNKYNMVDIHLDTFDVGHKITRLDIELAHYFQRVLKERGQEFGFVSHE